MTAVITARARPQPHPSHVSHIPPIHANPLPRTLQALAAFDELKGVLDALNRRVQLAEADEEKRQEALQQRRAGSHKWLARPHHYRATTQLTSTLDSLACVHGIS